MSAPAQASELRAEREGLLGFLYMCPMGLIQVTGSGAITLINPHAMSLLMPIAAGALVENLFDILRPHAPDLLNAIGAFPGTYGTVFERRRIQLPARGPEPSPQVLSCTVLMVDRDCLMVLLQDVSRDVAREAVDEAIRRRAAASERLVALGTMAAGLAHEINNPVAIIHAVVSDLAESAERGEAGAREIAAASAAVVGLCKRIEGINRNLLHLARDGGSDPFAPVPLAGIAEGAVDACEAFFRESGVELIVEWTDPSLVVSCREVQISQILVNLLQNALYAAKAQGGARRVRIGGRRRGTDVEVRVWDSGEGVPHAIRERIMEPFFTTKPVGEGSGLGLSISSRIALAHGGRIELDDREAETCFVLTLPAVENITRHDP